MLWSVWEPRNIAVARLRNDQDVVLTIPACTGQALGDCYHRFHRYDHARFQYRVAIFAQFETRLTAIIMAQHAEAVAVSKASVLQEVLSSIHFVQLARDIRTTVPWYQ